MRTFTSFEELNSEIKKRDLRRQIAKEELRLIKNEAFSVPKDDVIKLSIAEVIFKAAFSFVRNRYSRP